MFVEVGFESEGLVAALALVVLEGRVGLHVRAQVGAVRECLAAVCTAVGLLPCVGAQVALQQPGSGESLVADGALVPEVVCEDVHGERWHADVDLGAVGTLLGLLTVEAAVGLLVAGQVGRGGVLLAALATLIPVSLLVPRPCPCQHPFALRPPILHDGSLPTRPFVIILHLRRI